MDAVAWLSSNLEEMLDLPVAHEFEEFVAYEVRQPFRLQELLLMCLVAQRDPFEFGSRVVALSSGDGRSVELLK